MTSPLSSLKKERKTPLGVPTGVGKRSMPFRMPEYSLKEKQLLNDIHGNVSASNSTDSSNESPTITPHESQFDPTFSSSKELPTSIGSSRKSHLIENLYSSNKPKGEKRSSIPSDLELLSSMMQKITKLEKMNLQYSREIIEKDRRINVLEEKTKLLEKKVKSGETEMPPLIAELEAKCLDLKQQVHEMETFLADYGMIWVGEKSTPSSSKYLDDDVGSSCPGTSNGVWHPEDFPILEKEFVPNYDLIIENIKDLNTLAGDGEAKVINTTGGAKLKVTDPISLTLYKNGIVMFSGPFRSFEDQSTQRCMRDIMDGYFPSELQSRYPDGVPINITDKRFVVFEDPRHLERFPGVGNMLGGEEQPSNLVGSKLKMISPATSSVLYPAYSNPRDQLSRTEVTSELPGPKLTVEQFVSKLPKTVIRNGNIINIRETIAEQLTDGYSSTSSTELVDTQVVQEMQERMSLPETDRPPSARNVTTLRVKSEGGDKTLLVKMKFHETIADLRAYIDRKRPRGDGRYEIFSTFPSKVYSDDDATLEECGLTPNANLFLRFAKLRR